jgi:C4-dicarboxylate-specific signal transduction histidine kinase
VASEKMASLGRLSAGIMHEVNNPLNYIKTGLYVLKNKQKLLPEEQAGEYGEVLKDVEDGIARVQAIVAELRRFAHPSASQAEAVEAAAVVTSVLRFMSHELKDGVQVEQHLTAGHVLWGNRNKLLQVLVNLLQNALYAMKKKTFPGDERPTLWIESRMDRDQDLLIVRDNGVGIHPEDQGKIFEPFFTTKDVGEGMGLGLSICYRIIEEHQGKISVRSEPGRFCEFTIAIPRKA